MSPILQTGQVSQGKQRAHLGLDAPSPSPHKQTSMGTLGPEPWPPPFKGDRHVGPLRWWHSLREISNAQHLHGVWHVAVTAAEMECPLPTDGTGCP